MRRGEMRVANSGSHGPATAGHPVSPCIIQEGSVGRHVSMHCGVASVEKARFFVAPGNHITYEPDNNY